MTIIKNQHEYKIRDKLERVKKKRVTLLPPVVVVVGVVVVIVVVGGAVVVNIPPHWPAHVAGHNESVN